MCEVLLSRLQNFTLEMKLFQYFKGSFEVVL